MELNRIEGLIDVLLRERRFELWNAILKSYDIPEDIQETIHRWIACNCKYVPKIPKFIASPIVHDVLPDNMPSSPHHL
jgi:hypothetical protein